MHTTADITGTTLSAKLSGKADELAEEACRRSPWQLQRSREPETLGGRIACYGIAV